jgi:putative methionine-R-sulfoxide reductase with GAF domain
MFTLQAQKRISSDSADADSLIAMTASRGGCFSARRTQSCGDFSLNRTSADDKRDRKIMMLKSTNSALKRMRAAGLALVGDKQQGQMMDTIERHVSAIKKIAVNDFIRTLHCDRASIYLVDHRSDELLLFLDGSCIRVPLGKGIASACARTSATVNVSDAYCDERFNQNVDKRTGYRTRSLLCMPILLNGGEVMGVRNSTHWGS